MLLKGLKYRTKLNRAIGNGHKNSAAEIGREHTENTLLQADL